MDTLFKIAKADGKLYNLPKRDFNAYPSWQMVTPPMPPATPGMVAATGFGVLINMSGALDVAVGYAGQPYVLAGGSSTSTPPAGILRLNPDFLQTGDAPAEVTGAPPDVARIAVGPSGEVFALNRNF